MPLEDSKYAKMNKKTTSKWLKKAPNVSICSLTRGQAAKILRVTLLKKIKKKTESSE